MTWVLRDVASLCAPEAEDALPLPPPPTSPPASAPVPASVGWQGLILKDFDPLSDAVVQHKGSSAPRWLELMIHDPE